MKTIKNILIYSVLAVSITGCSGYVENEVDKIIADKHSDDIEFMAAAASMQCLTENKSNSYEDTKELVENFKRTVRNINDFNTETSRVKSDFLDMAQGMDKLVEVMKGAQSIDSNDPGIFDLLGMVGLSAKAETAKQEVEAAQRRAQVSLSDYNLDFQRRVKQSFSGLRDDFIIQITGRTDAAKYGMTAVRKALKRTYILQNPKDDSGCGERVIDEKFKLDDELFERLENVT